MFTLRGATHYDWEDMSAGPRNTLWFGDIGANASKRGDISVYRVKEPRRLKSRAVKYTRFRFKYSDGQSHNAEALLVNPVSGALMIVTKQSGGAAFYPRPAAVQQVRREHLASGRPGTRSRHDHGRLVLPERQAVRHPLVRAVYYYPSRSVRSKPEVYRLPASGESLAYLRHRVGC